MTSQAAQANETAENGAQGQAHAFQAEVSRLLHMMVHSVYSEKDVFLRELISNASDACDKLRYRALTDAALAADDTAFGIRITVDPTAKTLTVADNGIGMDRQDLIDNLGTIARSGTDSFLDALSGDEKTDMALIGKFGVGFYAAFMVAKSVRVISVKAGSDEAWEWQSDGLGSFTVEPTEDRAGLIAKRGTAVILSLRDGEDGYLEPDRLRGIIKTYSDHVAFPIALEEAGKADDEAAAADPVNTGGALWARAKSDVTEEQYAEFYRHVSHAPDDPLMTIHYRAEGRHEYSVLLFVPETRPLDLFEPERNCRMKLYVNKVFITCDAPLLPPYLRFMRGVVDSSDIPLTVSREMLQNNPIVASIRQALTKRILSELSKCAEKDPERFETFWTTFGAVLKEGIYEDLERRDQLLDLARFRTTKSGDGWRTLKEVVAGLKDGQTAIYYLTGESDEAVSQGPQLEGFKARDIEVLLLSDPVDAFWVSAITGYEGKPFQSITRGAADLDKLGETKPAEDKTDATDDVGLGVLMAAFKQALGDQVKDVRKSDRLTDSAVCLVADESGLDMHIEKILRSQKLGGDLPSSRVLEINPDHGLIASLAERAKIGVDGDVEDAAHLLLEQARIQQGEKVADPAGFARRLQAMLTKAL